MSKANEAAGGRAVAACVWHDPGEGQLRGPVPRSAPQPQHTSCTAPLYSSSSSGQHYLIWHRIFFQMAPFMGSFQPQTVLNSNKQNHLCVQTFPAQCHSCTHWQHTCKVESSVPCTSPSPAFSCVLHASTTPHNLCPGDKLHTLRQECVSVQCLREHPHIPKLRPKN